MKHMKSDILNTKNLYYCKENPLSISYTGNEKNLSIRASDDSNVI